jgi:hypothetical protein
LQPWAPSQHFTSTDGKPVQIYDDLGAFSSGILIFGYICHVKGRWSRLKQHGGANLIGDIVLLMRRPAAEAPAATDGPVDAYSAAASELATGAALEAKVSQVKTHVCCVAEAANANATRYPLQSVCITIQTAGLAGAEPAHEFQYLRWP